MLLTSWVRSFRQSLQARRRGNRRRLDWQTQSLHGDAGRRSRNTEQLEDRMLLTAFVVDQQFVDSSAGSINITNNTIDVDSDGTPEFDSIVFDDAIITGTGGVGVNINLTDLMLDRIIFQDVQVGDQSTGDNQTSGINITLNNVDLNALVFDVTTVFSGFGGGVDIDLVDVQAGELAVFQSDITGGVGAGLSVDISSVSRNATLDKLSISGTSVDGVALNAVGLQKSITDGLQTNPVRLTVPEHGLQTGTDVIVTGVEGLVEANTRATITNIDESTIELNGVDASGAAPYISGGTVTVLTNLGNVNVEDNQITGLVGLSVSMTDAEAERFSIFDNREIDSADLTLTRTPLDGLTVRDNRIDGDRPQVDALRFDLTESTLTSLVVNTNVIANTNSGLSGGDGIVFTAADSNVYGSISGNVISGMLGNAIQFDGTASSDFVDANRGPQVFNFNSLSAETTLAAAVDSVSTTIQVVDGRQFQPQQLILIDGEHLAVQAVNGNTLTVLRGQQGTLPLSHTVDSRVRSITTSASGVRRSIADNIISNSTGAGVFATLPENVALDASITGNTFTLNRSRAIDVTARNTIAPETTLQRGGISRTATTLNVTDASVFSRFTFPFDIQVEGETMTVTAIDGNSLTVVRGVNGTAARAHNSNTRAVAVQGDAVNLEIGSTAETDRNEFAFNRNGTIVLELQDQTGGSISVVNNVIIGTEGTDADAVRIDLTSVDTQVEATNILRRSDISGNLIGANAVAMLQVALPAGLTVFTVTDASGFSIGQTLRIEDEQVDVVDINGNILTVTRGVNSTTDAAHGAFAAVVPTTGGNIGRGLSVSLDERSTIEDFLVTGNIIANQGDDGLRFRREGDGVTRSFNPHTDQTKTISIVENTIIANAANPTADAQNVAGAPSILSGGIEVQALNGAEDSFDLEIIRNDILSHRNGGSINGINLRAEADALVVADIIDNAIRFSSGDGINTTDRNNSTDDRDVTITALKNTITDNDGAGIRFNSVAGSRQVAIVGLTGADPVDGRLYRNDISNNGREGIHIDGGGSGSRISIAGNTINDNGRISATPSSDLSSISIQNGGGGLGGDIIGSGILIDGSGTQVAITGNELSTNGGAGIDMNRSGSVSIRENTITFNGNDGIESSDSVEATILGNFIGSNAGRGIDVLVSEFHSANYMIGDGQESGRNRIIGNEEEGIYYVISTVDQDQNVLSQDNLDNDPIFETNNGNFQFALAQGTQRSLSPDAIFQVDTNTIDGNGVGTNSPTTGLFMRIGSTEGIFNTPYTNELGSETGPGSQSNINPNSRTNARIVNNSFGGNFGEDVRFETFVSTADPDATTGNWGLSLTPSYSGPGYDNDPLARLNLVFEGNSGDGLRANRLNGVYNNAEPTWKSRRVPVNNGSNAGGPSGPFPAAGTRNRSIVLTPSRNTQSPGIAAALNPAPDAIYNITDVSAVDIGNGVTELLVTFGLDVFGAYNGVIPAQIQSGDSVEIRFVNAVSGVQHSANGIFFFDVINRGSIGVGGAQIRLRATPDDNGADYLNGGQAIFNLNTTAAAPIPGQTLQFMYPGTGRSTMRIAQGADTAGSTGQDEFASGADFRNSGWETFIPLPYQEGTITNVQDAGGGRLLITAPNHSLSNGRIITIAEVEGLPGANRSLSEFLGTNSLDLLVVNQDQFTIRGTFNGTYENGGVWYTRDESFPDPDAPTFPLSDVVNVTPDPRSTTSGVVTVTFTEEVTGLDIDDIILLRDGVPVDISNILVQQISQTSYTLDLTSVAAAEGEYELIIDGSLPLASFVPVSPDPRQEPAGVVTVNFTEDVTGVDIFDFALYRNLNDGQGFQPVDLSELGANLSVTPVSASQYTIDLTSVTGDEGSYQFTLLGPRDISIDSNSGIVTNGSGEIVINAAGHGLVTGQTLAIEGIRGGTLGINTALNGTFRVIADNADSFRLADSTLTTVFLADDVSYSQSSAVFQFDSAILDRAGRQFKANADNVSSDTRESWVFASAAPTADIIDVDPDPRLTAVDTIAVSFSEPVVINTAGASDFRLTRDIGNGPFNVSLAGATLVPLDDPMGTGFASQFELQNLGINQPGDYRLTLVTFDSTRIQDRTGSFLAAPAIDDFTIVDTGAFPDIVNGVSELRTDPVGVVKVIFSEDVMGIDEDNAATNFTLTRDIGDGNGPQPVPLVNPMNNMPLEVDRNNARDYDIDLSPVTSDAGGASIDGVYLLTLLPGNGIVSVGDGEALAVNAIDTWTQDTTSPVAKIIEISPDPRIQHAGVVTVNFSEPVRIVDVMNASTNFELTRDLRDVDGPQPVDLAGVRVRAINAVDAGGNPVLPFSGGELFASTYVLDLSADGLTDIPGIYELSVTTSGSIVDVIGNSFVQDANAIDSWTLINRFNDDIIRDNVFTSDARILSVFGNDEVVFNNRVLLDSSDIWFTDLTPPDVVVKMDPDDPSNNAPVIIKPKRRNTPVGILTIDFTEPVSGFSLSDLILTRDDLDDMTPPDPTNVPLDGLTLNQVTDSRYTIDLNLKTGAEGQYVLTLKGSGSLIEDFAGNSIQDSDIELASWTVETVGPSAIVTVAPDPRSTTADNVQVSFTKEVGVAQVDVSDFRLERDTGTGFVAVTITGATISADSPVMGFDDSFTLDLSAVTGVEGTYRVTLVASDSGIIDQAGIEFASDAVDVWVLDNTNPTADIIDIAPDPRQTEVGTVNIVFSEGVTGVDLNDFVLLRDTGGGQTPVDISALTVTQQTDLRYTIDLTSVTAVDEATYELQLVTTDGATPILDLAGNPLLVDGSLGVAGVAALDSWFRGVDVINPTVDIADVTTPRANAAGVVTLTFSEDVTGVDINDIELDLDTGSGPNPVDISGLVVTPAPGSATDYLIDLSSVTVEQGTYTLRVVTTDTGSPIVDSAGNALAQSFAPDVADQITFIVQTIDPSAVIQTVTPDPRLRAVGMLTITFSQDVQGVDLSDFSLTRDTGTGIQPVSLRSVTVMQDPFGPGASQYVIDLTSVTGGDGNYVLTLIAEGSGITAVATGDPMTSDAIETWTTITTITVNTTNDTVDVNPGDGVVADSAGNVSLRAAVMEANALTGDDTIILPAGTYDFDIAGVGEDNAASGDLDITETTGTLTIRGAGASSTIIDADSLERVFHVLGGATLNLEGVTVTGGRVVGSEDGGGLQNVGGTVTITDSVITANTASGDAGGINNSGDLTLTRVTVSDNTAGQTAGGIQNSGTLTINASTIGGTSDPSDPTVPDLRNTSVLAGGGIRTLNGSTLTVTNSTIAGNVATSGAAQGAGLFTMGTTTLTNVTIAENESGGSGGGLAVAGGLTQLQNTLIANNVSVVTANEDVFDSTSGASINSLGGNLIENPTGAAGSFLVGNPNAAGDIVGEFPLLNRLADNGGPTATIALQPGSPAIDAGLNTTAATDQRGITRALDDFNTPNNGSLGIDIGAFEFGGFFVNSLGDTIDVNPGDGLAEDQFGNTTLRAAIMEANALNGNNTIILGDGVHELSLTELDTTAPTADIVDVTPDPLNDESTMLDPVDEITVNFSEPVQVLDPVSMQLVSLDQLSSADVIFDLTRDDGTGPVTVDLSTVTIRQNSDTQYVLEGLTSLLAQDGLYELRLLATDAMGTTAITDFALMPNTLADDQTANIPRVAAIETFVRGADVFAPTATLSQVTSPRTTNPGIVTLNFSEAVFGVDLSSDPANFSLTYDDDGAGPNAPQVVSLATVAVQQVSPSEYTLDLTSVLDFNSLTDLGTYSLSFNGTATTIFDFATNQYTAGIQSTTWSVVIDTTAPSADIVDVSPDPRIGTVGTVTVQFDENVTGVDLADAEVDFDLLFDVDGFDDGTGQNPGTLPVQIPLVDALSNPLLVTQVSDSEYTIDLSSVTAADGEYRLVLTTDGNIFDSAGNPLAATLGNGETAEDRWRTGDSLETTDVAGAFGDLDIRDASPNGQLLIVGSGAGVSTIDANMIDRVFDVANGSSLRLENLTVTGGQLTGVKDGAGIRSEGLLSLSNTEITGNVGDGNGGAVYTSSVSTMTTLSAAVTLTTTSISVANVGVFPATPGFFILVGNEQMLVEAINATTNVLTVSRGANESTPATHSINATVSLLNLSVSTSTLSGNSADFGAGVFIDDGTVAMVATTLQGNAASTDGGGIYNDRNASLTVSGSTVLSNTAGRDGAGFYNNASATIDIVDTTVTGNIAARSGGGLFNEIVSTATLNNTRFSANSATDGGGVYNQDGQVTITGGSLIANAASNDGGGLFVSSSAITTLTDTTLSGNTALRDGGATRNDGTLNVSNVTFAGNAAERDGGAISNNRTLNITDSTLDGNTAAGDGGALDLSSVGIVTLAASTLRGNIATGNGGAISNNGASRLTMTETTLDGNTASANGGGLFHSSSVVTNVSASTISRNQAANGGGLSTSGTINITNATVSGNAASQNGGGLHNTSQATLLGVTVANNIAAVSGGGISSNTQGGNASLKNTIVARNMAPANADINGIAFQSQGNNLIGDGGGVTVFVDDIGGNLVGTTGSEVDPLLSPLQDNGGATLTHALLFGSPARDNGNNVGVPQTDQRGFDRRFDGDGDGTVTVDIGAFESGLTVNSFLDTVDVNPGERSSADEDGNSTLRAAVMEANALPGADTIVLLPGTYRLTIAGRDENNATTGDLDITESLTIIGAGEGNTIIDASGLDRAFHVIAGASLDLKGVTIINGDADLGGVILNQGALTTENVTISDSTALLGGGIYNDIVVDELAADIQAGSGTLTVTDVSVFPRAAGFTIAINNEQLRVESISGDTFTVTRAVNGTTAAAHSEDDAVTLVATSSVSLVSTLVTDNEALLNGGGIYNNDELNIVLSVVTDNTAGVRGGGLYNTDNVTINQSTFDSNRADVRGGAIFNEGTTVSTPSTISINASTLSDNHSGARGGAIFNSDVVTLLNSTISGNTAGGEGGAIFNTGPDQLSSGSLEVVNSTIVSNSSDLSAGGIFNEAGSAAELTNSIVAGNTAIVADDDVQGAFISIRTNFIGTAGSSTGLVNGQNGNLVGTALSPIDPVFGPLANNGGPTQTHALLVGSPAIDAGDNSGGVPLDQRGGRRPTDTTSDIGAFEGQLNNLSINDVTMVEGNAGSTLFTFTVLLEAVAADPVTVSFGTIQDTAQQGSDFLASAGTLVFAPGELSKTVTVEVNGDTTTEATEQFFVQLFNPMNAVLTNDRGVGTILNDDAIVDFADVNVIEGDTGTATATFNVVLSNATSADITLGYQTVAGTATEGPAAVGGDYLESSGTLMFAAGETSKSFTVTVNGDTAVETFETFFANLTLLSGSVQLPDPQAVGTIQNDDIALADISSPSVTETTGTNTTVTFTVGLTTPNAFDVAVDVQTVNGTAVGGADYVAIPPTTVTILAGNLTATQDVTIIGDTDFEGGATGTPETFNLEYIAGTITRDGVTTAGTLGAAGTASITDDELPPTVWVIRATAANPTTTGEIFRDGTDDGVFNPVFERNYALIANAETVNGDPGTQNDRFIVDFVNGNPIPDGGLTIDGGDETSGDSMEIVDTDLITPFTFDSVIYTSTGVDSGTVLIEDGDPTTPLTRTITYAELEPVLDTVAAVNRTFAIDSGANPGDHQISVSDAGGRTIIDDNGTNAFESVTFTNPTATLTLNAGDGNNTISLEALDAAFAASFTVDGQGGDDNINANGVNVALSMMGSGGTDTLIGGSLNDTIDGGLGSDSIEGGAGIDVLNGGADNDTIKGDMGADTIDGGAGNDSIEGGSEGDSLIGGTEDDTILGEDGDDFIDGSSGSDSLTGGNGNDTIVGRDGGDVIDGGAGQDSLDGGDDADTVDGGADNDIVLGGDGTDSVSGGDGDDTVNGGDDNDTLSGGGGTDSIIGGDGNDQVSETAVDAETIILTDTGLVVGGLSDTVEGIEEFILTGGDLSSLIDASAYTRGNVTLNGEGGDDTLIGSNGDDFINGGSGNDTATGGQGNDSMLGGGGSDSLDGGSANDTLAGNAGEDTINGGTGLDSIDGGAGNDIIDGGDDNDTVLAGAGFDSVDGGLGNDRILGGGQDDTLNGDGGDDSLIGGSGDDMIRGGDGIDTLNGQSGHDDLNGDAGTDTAFGGAGRDTLTGGLGIDNLDGQGSSFDVIRLTGEVTDDVYTLDRSDNFNQLRKTSGTTYGVNFKRTETIEINTLDGNDTITVVQDLLGSDGDAALVINFGDGNNSLDASLNTDVGKTFIVVAGSGNDTLKGGAGPDNLNAGSGDDSIDGGAGNDTLTGGAGADAVNGDGGADVVSGGTEDDTLSGGSENDTITGGTGNDSIRGNEGDDSIQGENGNDLIYGDAGNDDIDGGRGDDSIDGGANDDTVLGQDGNDLIKGGSGTDSLVGGRNDDTIDGGNGNDFVNGNLGFDVLLGGADNDRLLGGSDADIVVGGTGADEINGQGSGSDTLVGETALDGAGDDTPDPGDSFDSAVEIDNAFVLPTAILDKLNSF